MIRQVMMDFEDRVREVDLFFLVLLALDNEEIAIVPGNGPQNVEVGQPLVEWGRMLKGSAYLVLYNLVEAFVKRGCEAVFASIKDDGLCGTELTELVRKEWINQRIKIRKNEFDRMNYVEVVHKIVHQVITEVANNDVAELSKDLLPISGNLDAKAVRKICNMLGVVTVTPKEAKGGSQLDTIMSKRNSLAHGSESFEECGRDLTTSELVLTKNETVRFMRSILDNIEQFIEKKGYRLARESG